MKTNLKNAVLKTLAELIEKNLAGILSANQKDLDACADLDASLLERLKLNEAKVLGMVAAINKVIALEDPEGKLLNQYTHENGLKMENKTVPFGKALIIYESRPDVTIEASAVAFKAGNIVLLKGGKEAKESNIALVDLWKQALSANACDTELVRYLDLDREATQDLIRNKSEKLDLIIPRGGEGLIDFVIKNAGAPVMISGRGNNFLFVDKEADFEMAIRIILNGKQRLSVCNALDKVLIHKDLPDLEAKKQSLINQLEAAQIEVLQATDPALLAEEFLAAKIVVNTVQNVEEAIATINTYSGGHSASIITSNKKTAEQFQNEVDCAAVYHNASTRFTDGGEFGFGAEIAISTQKLHARGPIGIEELVTNKWFIYGTGQTR